MGVERVETFIIDVPTIRPHVLSVATMASQAMVLVKITCFDGVSGIGEASTIGGLSYGEESPEGIKQAINLYIAPLLRTGATSSPARAMMVIRRNIVGNRFAKSAVEMALLDAEGKRRGLPLSELLGGRVRDSVPVLWALASGVAQTDIDEAEAMLARRRHNCFKLKIGKRDLREDAAHAARIKKALGDRASLRVDVNQAWTRSEAQRGVRMLADAGVDLVEQPLAGDDRAGMRQLAATSPIPVMADEALLGPADAFAFAQEQAAQAFSIKAAQSGGLTKARDVIAIAQASGVELYGGTMLEGGIGSVASAHLFATVPTIHWGTEFFGPLLQTTNILTEPLAYEDFVLKLPAGPGLGVALDEEQVRRFRRDS